VLPVEQLVDEVVAEGIWRGDGHGGRPAGQK
jgi:hypothetical protein